MAQARAKQLEFAASVDGAGRIGAGRTAVELGDEWSAESLVLAGLLRCSLTSFRYHARRGGITVVEASGTARGVVTKRESDGRYALVEVEAELDVVVEPMPADLQELIAKAERDCFVGASLTVPPLYRWRVNGADV